MNRKALLAMLICLAAWLFATNATTHAQTPIELASWQHLQDKLKNDLSALQLTPPDPTTPFTVPLDGSFYYGSIEDKVSVILPAWEKPKNPVEGQSPDQVVSCGQHTLEINAIRVNIRCRQISLNTTFEEHVAVVEDGLRGRAEKPLSKRSLWKQGNTITNESKDFYYDLTVKYRTYGPFKGRMFILSPQDPAAQLAGFMRRSSFMGGPVYYDVSVPATPIHPEVIEACFEFSPDDKTHYVVTIQTYNTTHQRYEIPFPSEKEMDDLMNKIALYIAQEFDLIPEFEPQSDCGKTQALTRFLQDLRDHHKKIAALDGELDTLLRHPDQKKQFIITYGQRIEGIGNTFLETLQAFRDAETRRGLLEEFDLIADSVLTLNAVVDKYEMFAGVNTTTLERDDTNKAKAEVVSDLADLTRRVYAARLESEGLQDILTSDSWNEAIDKTVFHSQRKLNEFLDQETEHVFGFGFHDGRSAERALQMKLRREIHRQVAKLLVKITSNELVIELAAGPIIRWLERDLIPHLKESLRHKGHLPERVERSIKTLESARTMLHSLSCDAKLTDVRRTLAQARGIQNETVFLERDLRSFKNQTEMIQNTPMIDQLGDAKAALETTIKFTTSRFLLNKDDYNEDLKDAIGMVQEMILELQRAIRAVAK